MSNQIPPRPRPWTLVETHMWYRYDKKFAFLPVKGENGWIWFCTYYEKYLVFSYHGIGDMPYLQSKLSAKDAVVDKLSGGSLTF